MKVQQALENKIKSECKIELTEENVAMAVSLLGLENDNDYSEAVEERIDAIFSSFRLCDNLEGVGGLIDAFKVCKEIGLNAGTQNDDEFLDSIEVISLLLISHKYDTLVEISPSELSKIRLLYQTFGKKLNEITLLDIDSIQKLEITAITNLQKISEKQLKLFCDFISKLNLSLNSSYELFQNAIKLQGVLEALNYEGKSWLEEKEIKKISLLFGEFEMYKIELWKDDTSDSLVLLARGFELNLPGTSWLILKKKISDIKKLEVHITEGSDTVKQKLEVIKYLKKDLDNLNQLEITKLVKLFKILGIEGTGVAGITSLLSWLESKDITLDIDRLDKKSFEKVEGAVKKLKIITGKKLKAMNTASIVVIERLLDAFGVEDLMTTQEDQLKALSHVIQTSAEDMGGIEGHSLPDMTDVFNIFQIDPQSEDQTRYNGIREFLRSFDIKLVELSESRAESLVSTMTSLGVKKGEAYLDKPKLKEAILEAVKVFEYESLIKIDTQEVEKLMMLGGATGIDEISEIKKSDIAMIKIISDSLEFSFKDATKTDIKILLNLLRNNGFGEAGSEHGWFSYLTQGKEAAFKKKLTEIKNKIEVLGYKRTLDFDEERYLELDRILAVDSNSKGFSGTGLRDLEKFSNFCKKFGYDTSKEPFYRLYALRKTLSLFGISPFNITEEEERGLKAIEENCNTKIGDLKEAETERITEFNSKYNLDIKAKKFVADFKILNESHQKLGFSSLIQENEEFKSCIAELESLSVKESNLEKLESISGLVTKFVKVEELELSSCTNLCSFLKPLNYDEGAVEEIAFKTSLIVSIAQKCKLDFDKEVKGVVTDELSKTINNYNKYRMCTQNPESEECKDINEGAFSDVEAMGQQICNNYNDHGEL